VSANAGDGNREIFDTISETRGERMSVVKGGSTTHVPYSNGIELTWEKTEEGDGTRLKEVRTLTKTKAPHSLWSRTRYRAGQYETIFQKTTPEGEKETP
jgi:hypothetical protein